MCVVRFQTIFSSFSVSRSITPLQFSTNWLFSVSFTDLTTPAAARQESEGVGHRAPAAHVSFTFYDGVGDTSTRSLAQQTFQILVDGNFLGFLQDRRAD